MNWFDVVCEFVSEIRYMYTNKLCQRMRERLRIILRNPRVLVIGNVSFVKCIVTEKCLPCAIKVQKV